jgi:hypothetical protein
VKVHDLARETDRSKLDVVKALRELGFNITSGYANLTVKQVEAVRRKFQVDRPRVRSAAVVKAPPPPRSWTVTVDCCCCHLREEQTLTTEDDGSRKPCNECADHFEIEGENAGRVRAREASHSQLLRRRWEAEMALTEDLRNRMRMGYASRDRWKAALVRVILAHEATGTGCRCGAKSFPCSTVHRLEEVNKGIAREVERLGTLSEEDLQMELAPRQP